MKTKRRWFVYDPENVNIKLGVRTKHIKSKHNMVSKRELTSEKMKELVVLLRNHLYERYQQKENNDFIFKARRLQDKINYPTGMIRLALIQLAKDKTIRRYNSHYWITNFRPRPLKQDTIKIPWWKRLLS